MAISRNLMERQLRAGGGIMTLEEPRQGYFLGKIVKKAKKAVKKVVKSPLGKVALGAAALKFGGPGIAKLLGRDPTGFLSGRFMGDGGIFSAARGLFDKGNLLAPLVRNKAGEFSLGRAALTGLGATAIAAPFFMGGDEEVEEEVPFSSPMASVEAIRDQAKTYYGDPTNSALYFMPPKSAVRSSFYAADGGLAREGYRVGGGVMGMLQKAGGAMKNLKNNILTKLGRMTDDVEIQTTYDDAADTGPSMDTMITAKSGKGKQILDQLVEEGVAEVDEGVYYIKDFDEAMMGLQEGGIKASGAKLGTDKFTPIRDFESGPYESVEESMIRNLNKRADGGLMDLGGLEKDYREGGFVPLGAEERADDVPARLSKNEFVFTADAVRNAGQGDIDKGAEVMQNMMDNLEAGGTISEESQGKNPAQAMFDQAQQLESRIA